MFGNYARDELSAYEKSRHSRQDLDLLHIAWLKATLVQSRVYSGAALHLVLLGTHGGGVVAVALKICPESHIFVGDGVLSDVGKEEEGQECTEDTKCRRNKERILSGTVSTGSSRRIVDDEREDISTNEGADLSTGRRDSIVLASNCSG